MALKYKCTKNQEIFQLTVKSSTYKLYTHTHTHTQRSAQYISSRFSNFICAAASPGWCAIAWFWLYLKLMPISFAPWLWPITCNLCKEWKEVYICLSIWYLIMYHFFKISFRFQVVLTCLDINNHLMTSPHSWPVIFSITWSRNNVFFKISNNCISKVTSLISL